LELKKGTLPAGEWRNTLLFSAGVFIVSTFLILSFPGFTSLPYLLILTPVMLSTLYNLQFGFFTFIVSIFVNRNFLFATGAEVVAALFILTFFVTHRFEREEFKNSLQFPFYVFILSILPSYVNSVNIIYTSVISLRLVEFFFLFTIIPATFSGEKGIKRFINLYMAMALLNGLHLIVTALITGDREFGFAGIMYVDLVGLAITISMMYVLYKKQNKKYSLLLFFILLAALILTQTRNAWISTALTMLLMTIQFLRRENQAGRSIKKYIRRIVLVLVIIGVTFFVLYTFNPMIVHRWTEPSVSETGDLAEDLISIGSLTSRFFVWHTAFMAFLSSPVIGIGFYSFPFASKLYSELHPLLYEIFVKNLSPHLTILALLAEAGILGFLGFLFFMTAITKKIYGLMVSSRNSEYGFYSTLFFWLTIYMIISMMMTDAWLWGRLLMLWGIILGFINLLSKELNKKALPADNAA